MRKILRSILVGISLLFKKASEGMATSTGLAVAPQLKNETENVVVQKKQDNYYEETMGKSLRQFQYEQRMKELGIIENQYPHLDWEKFAPSKDIDWSQITSSDEDIKPYLKELRMTEEQFKQFRETLKAK